MKSMLALAVAALLMTASVEATLVVPKELDVMARDAHAIVRGRVVAADSQWSEGRRGIETIVTLEAETYLKGALGTHVRFRVPGGVVGRFRNLVVGAPTFAPGQRVIVFLGASGPSVPFVLGLGQGVYRLNLSSSGDWLVAPSTALPGGTTALRQGSTERAPAQLQAFETVVRTLVSESR